MYESVGVITNTELELMCKLAESLQQRLVAWLKQHHAALVPPAIS